MSRRSEGNFTPFYNETPDDQKPVSIAEMMARSKEQAELVSPWQKQVRDHQAMVERRILGLEGDVRILTETMLELFDMVTEMKNRK